MLERKFLTALWNRYVGRGKVDPVEAAAALQRLTLVTIRRSVTKWYKVSDGKKKDRGVDNCALCKIFYSNGDCTGCPVMQKTGKSQCDGSPYERWVAHQRECHPTSFEDDFRVRCPACQEIAEAEIEFLEDLLAERRVPRVSLDKGKAVT